VSGLITERAVQHLLEINKERDARLVQP